MKLGVVGPFRYDYMQGIFKRIPDCEIIYVPESYIRAGANVRQLLESDVLWTNVPYYQGLVASMLHSTFQIPFVLNLEGYPWLQHVQHVRCGVANLSLQDLAELAFHFADRIVTYPDCCRGRFVDRYPEHAAKTTCVPYGCRFSGRAVPERPLDRKPVRLLLVSNVELYEKYAGAVMVVDMMEHLKDDVSLTVAVAGDTRNELRAYIESKKDPRVRYLGYVEDMGKLYAESDIMVYATFQDLMTYALVEAQYWGLPVVVASEHNSPENVKGLFVPMSAERLAHGVSSLIADPMQRQALGRAGAKFVREHLSDDAIAQQYSRLFREVIEANERGGGAYGGIRLGLPGVTSKAEEAAVAELCLAALRVTDKRTRSEKLGELRNILNQNSDR